MKFSEAWKLWEGLGSPLPQRVRKVVEIGHEEFRAGVDGESMEFVAWMVKSLSSGDVVIIKGMFDPAFMVSLREKTVEWQKGRWPSFHKMLEGSPDFHRVIDLEAGKKYAFQCCKHSAYFYRWNDDPLGIWPTITENWRLAKVVMGLDPDEYERFTPKDGVVDRIQVVRYPPAIGFLEPHQDPHQHQRLFFSGYMSKRGVDFEGGGFYLVDSEDKVFEIEDRIDVGDACLGCATLFHGVAPCDRKKTPDWGKTDGRWFLSMYSNASDEVRQRHTGHPVKLELEGVTP